MPLIKRYPNRKLYDTEAKSYVTLDNITEMIRAGQDVHVIDHESGDDLTTLTLSQIILEQEKKTSGFLPRSLLTSLIRTGGDTIEQVMRSVQSGLGVVGDEELHLEAAEPEKPPSKTSQAHAAIDERIADMLEVLNVPTRRDMRQLQDQLAALSIRLEQAMIDHGLDEIVDEAVNEKTKPDGDREKESRSSSNQDAVVQTTTPDG